MPFLALLKLIPGKAYLYAGIVIAVLLGVHWWNHHEQGIGSTAALAPVTALAHKAEIQVVAGAAVAQTTETQNAKDYIAALAVPPPVDLGIVCHRQAASSGELPEAVGVTATRIGKPAADVSVGPDYDPSGAVLERAKRAEAQVIYLQARVHELETQMVNSP